MIAGWTPISLARQRRDNPRSAGFLLKGARFRRRTARENSTTARRVSRTCRIKWAVDRHRVNPRLRGFASAKGGVRTEDGRAVNAFRLRRLLHDERDANPMRSRRDWQTELQSSVRLAAGKNPAQRSPAPAPAAPLQKSSPKHSRPRPSFPPSQGDSPSSSHLFFP